MSEIPRQEENLITENKSTNPENENKKPDFSEKSSLVGPDRAGVKDSKQLENFLKNVQSEILLKKFGGDNSEQLGVNDIKLHDTEFYPKKMAEIERDSQAWVSDMPDILTKLKKDPAGYHTYVDFLKSAGRDKEIVSKEEYSTMLDKLETALERKDSEAERLIKEHYERKRLEALMGAATETEKQEPVENPYKEIEKRLSIAEKQLKEAGLNKDAENLSNTIARLQKQIESGEYSDDILLWNEYIDSSESHGQGIQTSKLENLILGVNSVMEKIPLIGKILKKMNVNYKENIRPAGGTIIRADGTYEDLFTFSRFTKNGEKTHTANLAGSDYDYVTELQSGDEIVSWQPSEEGKKIIMESLGGMAPSTPNKFASALGESNIQYWTSEFNADNVKFRVRHGEDLENRQFYSTARLQIFPPPYPFLEKIGKK